MRVVGLVVVLLVACGDDAGKGAADGADSAGDVIETEADADVEPADTTVAETTPETSPETSPETIGDTIEDEVSGSTERLDDDLEPCEHPEYWPFSILSETYPVRVHYRMPSDRATALESLGILETSWRREVDEIGWDAPLDDIATCGPDGAVDVFTWRGASTAYVNIWEEYDATPWDDGYPYMVVDPWGEYGGEELPVTLAHEFNHMCQTAYDWSDATFIYEATATFMEDEVYDDHNSFWYLLFDFQGNPDWSIDRDDDYETWYMYGAGLWLRFLRDRYYKGDPSFAADLWAGMRSPSDENEPDYIDSLDALLARFAKSTEDAVVEFARWRWYVEARDDGLHMEEAGDFPRDAVVAVAAKLDSAGDEAIVEPMMLGTSYIDIVTSGGGPTTVTVSVQTAVPAGVVHWVVQALPGIGGNDGELLELPAVIELTDVGGVTMRTLAVTALPGIDSDIDPDERTDDRYAITVRVLP